MSHTHIPLYWYECEWAIYLHESVLVDGFCIAYYLPYHAYQSESGDTYVTHDKHYYLYMHYTTVLKNWLLLFGRGRGCTYRVGQTDGIQPSLPQVAAEHCSYPKQCFLAEDNKHLGRR